MNWVNFLKRLLTQSFATFFQDDIVIIIAISQKYLIPDFRSLLSDLKLEISEFPRLLLVIVWVTVWELFELVSKEESKLGRRKSNR